MVKIRKIRPQDVSMAQTLSQFLKPFLSMLSENVTQWGVKLH
jgi:hypothetical protein